MAVDLVRLVESDDVAEILSRLAAISSREKALECLGGRRFIFDV